MKSSYNSNLINCLFVASQMKFSNAAWRASVTPIAFAGWTIQNRKLTKFRNARARSRSATTSIKCNCAIDCLAVNASIPDATPLLVQNKTSTFSFFRCCSFATFSANVSLLEFIVPKKRSSICDDCRAMWVINASDAPSAVQNKFKHRKFSHVFMIRAKCKSSPAHFSNLRCTKFRSTFFNRYFGAGKPVTFTPIRSSFFIAVQCFKCGHISAALKFGSASMTTWPSWNCPKCCSVNANSFWVSRFSVYSNSLFVWNRFCTVESAITLKRRHVSLSAHKSMTDKYANISRTQSSFSFNIGQFSMARWLRVRIKSDMLISTGFSIRLRLPIIFVALTATDRVVRRAVALLHIFWFLIGGTILQFALKEYFKLRQKCESCEWSYKSHCAVKSIQPLSIQSNIIQAVCFFIALGYKLWIVRTSADKSYVSQKCWVLTDSPEICSQLIGQCFDINIDWAASALNTKCPIRTNVKLITNRWRGSHQCRMGVRQCETVIFIWISLLVVYISAHNSYSIQMKRGIAIYGNCRESTL